MKFDVVFSSPPWGRTIDWRDFQRVNRSLVNEHMVCILPGVRNSSAVVEKWDASHYYKDVQKQEAKIFCYIMKYDN